uniref:non-specific serine/threonine protein kinase n=1 Tax=Trypanosoma congolense (strain IL3000) TaxID=1068625 RepID=G0UKZ2_TRYCI|nr:putative protein kinase [Trypanosoma congolense IL3000]
MNKTLLNLVDSKRCVANGLMNAPRSHSLHRLMSNSLPVGDIGCEENMNSPCCSNKNDGGAVGHTGSNREAKTEAQHPSVKQPPKAAKTRATIGMRFKRWVLTGRIGAGSFGETFTAVEVDRIAKGSRDHEYPLELLPIGQKDANSVPFEDVCIKIEQENKNVLRIEAAALKKMQTCPYVARYLGSGIVDGMSFIAMQRLGPNLADLRRSTPQSVFSLYTTLHLGMSCLRCIQGIHQLGIIHRDVKPSNFVIGLGGSSDPRQCYIVDFGLARRYRRGNGDIRPPRPNAGFRGTSRYASLASHRQQELGRVDDIWSLLFMLIEFVTGTLPWRKHKDKEDIGQCKAQVIGPDLIKSLPKEFEMFLTHLQTLKYEDEPRYDMLLALMEQAMERGGYPRNQRLDWEPEEALHTAALHSSTGTFKGGISNGNKDLDSSAFVDKHGSREIRSRVRSPTPPQHRRFMPPPPPVPNGGVRRHSSIPRFRTHVLRKSGSEENNRGRGSVWHDEVRSANRPSDVYIPVEASKYDPGEHEDASQPSALGPTSQVRLVKSNSAVRRRFRRRRVSNATHGVARGRHTTVGYSDDGDVGSTYSPCEVEELAKNGVYFPPEQVHQPIIAGSGHNIPEHCVSAYSCSMQPYKPHPEMPMGALRPNPAQPTLAPPSGTLPVIGENNEVRQTKEKSSCTCGCM